MSSSQASTPALFGLAFLAVTLFAVSEKSLTPVHAAAWQRKQQAVRIMQRAERALREEKARQGVAVDARNDPLHSGVIGPQFSLITTDRGSQNAKMLAAHPNFAAAVTQMLLEAGVGKGDLVPIGMTGSLPGFDLAVLAACKAIGAEPIVITSLGASMFGATDPNFTWLDMEKTLRTRGVWEFGSVAASLGGGSDVGRGLSPQGRELLHQAIARNGVRLLEAPTMLDAVRERVAIYDSIATLRGRKLTVYVNVGGGVASMGGAQNARLIPPGLTMKLARRNYPNRGVVNVLGERGLPSVQLLDVERLARRYDILGTDGEPVKPGRGMLFVRFRYNLWMVALSTLVLLAANFYVLRLDLRQKLLGRPHPERNTA